MSYKIFDYRCPICGHVAMDVMVDEPTSVFCPNEDVLMDRLISAPGMVKTNHADKPGFKNRQK